MNPKDNQANIKNPNRGTKGTNRQYDQAQGNRGKQLSPTPNNANQGTKSPQKKKA